MKKVLKNSISSALSITMLLSATSPLYAQEEMVEETVVEQAQEDVVKQWSINRENTEQYVDTGSDVTLQVEFDTMTYAGDMYYQWYDASGNTMEGQTSITLQVNGVEKNTSYSCKVSDGTNEETVTFNILVNKSWEIDTSGCNVYVRAQETATLTVEFEDEEEDDEYTSFTYQWYNQNNSKVGTSSKSYTTGAISTDCTYTCVVTDPNGVSDTVTFHVYVRNIPSGMDDFEVSFSSGDDQVSMDINNIEVNGQSYMINSLEVLSYTNSLPKTIRVTFGTEWTAVYTFTFVYEDGDISQGTLTDISIAGQAPQEVILTKGQVFTMEEIGEGPIDGKYKITFELYGGTNPSDTITTYNDFDDLITYLKEPTLSGKVFIGWYLDPDFKHNLEDYEEMEGDITLYAKWGSPREHAKLIITYNVVRDGKTEEFKARYSDFDIDDNEELEIAIHENIPEDLAFKRVSSKKVTQSNGVYTMNMVVNCEICPSKGTLRLRFEDENGDEVAEEKIIANTYIADLDRIDTVIMANMINGYRLESADYGYAYMDGTNGIRVMSATVVPAPNVSSVELNSTYLKMKVDQQSTLTAKMVPTNHGGSSKVTWSSSNDSIAKVSSSGVVTAKGQGTALIYATSSDGMSGVCTVRVWPTELSIKDLTMDNTGVTVSWDALDGAQVYNVYRRTSSSDWTRIGTDVKETHYLDNTVKDGVQYTYWINAVDGSMKTTYKGATRSITYLRAPLIQSIKNVKTGIELTWTKKTGASTYSVYRSNGSEDVEINCGTATTYTDTDVENNTQYTYKVSAYATGRSSSKSTAATLTRLVGPTTVSSKIVESGIEISWNAVEGAASYDIYKKSDSTANSLIKIEYADTTFVDTDVEPGVKYTYQIRSRAAETMSSLTTSKAMMYVSTPVISSITNTTSGFTVKWGAVTGATSYDIYQVVDGETVKVGTSETNSFTDTSETVSGQTYTYQVVANTDTSSSLFSVTKSAYRLTTPELGSVVNQKDGVSFTWKEVIGANSYKVYRKEDDGYWRLLKDKIEECSYVDTTAVSATKYSYSVRAIYDTIQSSYNTTGKTIKFVAQPVIKSVTNTDTGFTVKYGAIEEATSYVIYVMNGDSLEKVGTSTTTSFNDDVTVTTTGQQYTYVVKAKIGSYISDGSEEFTQLRLVKPSLIKAVNGQTGVDFSWKAVDGASTYNVYRKVEDGSWKLLAKGVDELTYTDTTVESGKKYYYSVKAVNGSVVSTYNATGKSVTYLSKPVISSVVNTQNELKITWKAVTGAASYIIYDEAGNKVGTSTTTSFTDTNATGSGTTYNYQVKAKVGSATYSALSETKSCMKLAQPTLSSAKNGDTGVIFTWKAVNGATAYNVYRKVSGGSWALKAKDVEGTSWTDTSATSGKKYYYTVKAKNGSAISTYNDTGKYVTYLAKPEIVKCTRYSTYTSVKFNAVTGAEKYILYKVNEDGTKSSLTTITATSATAYTYKDTSAKTAGTYRYVVRAKVGSATYSVYSDTFEYIRS